MLNRLGLVIHWSGLVLGGFALLLTLIALVSEGYYEWETQNRNLSRIMLEGLQRVWYEEREAELTPKGKSILEQAREAGLIDDLLRPGKSKFGGVPIPSTEQEIRDRIKALLGAVDLENPPDYLKPSLLMNLKNWSNPWYLYVLGLLFSPLILLLTISPFWATRFILTSHKSLLPWVVGKSGFIE
jgi:hypothetical protein